MTGDPYAAFVPFYDAWTARDIGDVEFFVRRALASSDPVLDLCAGNGRVAVEVARAGRRVVAVDISAAMIEDGRRRAAEAGVADSIEWVQADLRDYVAAQPVELAMIPFRSFLHMTSTPDQLIALGNVHESLLPGGRLLMNMFVPDPAVIVENDGRRRVQRVLADPDGSETELWAIARYETTTQMLWLEVGADRFERGALVSTTKTDLELRLVYRYEMEHLLARVGFEVEALYGGFDERPLTESDREMIWVARKP